MTHRGEIEVVKEYRNQTVWFKNRPNIVGSYSIAGEKEGEGPLKKYIHQIFDDCYFGEKTHEGAEQKMFETAIRGALKSANLTHKDVDMMLAGDLLNQITSSSFAARSFDMSFIGLYGACSTMALTLGMGALMVDGGYAKNVVVCAGSHFATAERQYRTPLELGNQRSPLSQWTVTGCGATVISAAKAQPNALQNLVSATKNMLSTQKDKPKSAPQPEKKSADREIFVSSVTFGKVTDWGVRDVNNMGAAMAPAAAMTIVAHLRDIGIKPVPKIANQKEYSDAVAEFLGKLPFDAIFTGDLGKLGEEILRTIMSDNGYPLDARYTDCGRLMFSEKQNLYQGASGCGCSAVTLNSFILDKLRRGDYKKILFVATGALLSPVSSYQGNTVPGIAHGVVIESR